MYEVKLLPIDWENLRLRRKRLLRRKLAKTTMGHNKRRQKVNKGQFRPEKWMDTHHNRKKVLPAF